LALKRIKTNAPKNKIDKDKTREEKQEKLKQLQQQFLQKNKSLANSSSSIIKTEAPKIFNINKLKADKDINEHLNNTNKKLEEMRIRDKKNKYTIFKLKTQINTLNENFNIEKKTNNELSEKLNKYLLKINQLETNVSELKESYSKQAILELKQNIGNKNTLIKEKDENIVKLKNHIFKLNEAIKKYKEQIFELNNAEDLTKKDRAYFQNQFRMYALENSKLREQLSNIEQEYKQKVMKLANNEHLINNFNNKNLKGKLNPDNKRRLFGVLKTINGLISFVDIDGNEYPANIDSVTFRENAPCKAVVRYNKNNIAKIQEVYDEKDEFIKELKESKIYKREQKRKEFLYEDVDYKNKYNVLIIGAENKKDYMNILEKIGLNVTWFNSYEANIVRLRNMLDRNDVVICCLRHSRHYASNLMTYMIEHDYKNFMKYNIVDKDNVEHIVGRVRYCIENM